METTGAINSVLLYTMVLNLLVAAGKIAVGYSTGTLSILASGFDSAFDSVTNVVGLVATHLAHRPPDEDHPYGHRRYETLLTLGISALLFVSCYEILRGAYERLMNPVVPDVSIWSFASLFLSIGVQMYTSNFEKRKGKELKSEFLLADASHTAADVYVTSGVIAGLVAVRLGYAIVDPLVAVAVVGFIAKIGIDIIRGSTRILTDAAALEISYIAAIVRQVPGVESYHHVRSRGQEDDVHLDLHVRVAPDMPTAQAHSIAHEVQRRLMEGIEGVRDVIVHIEPEPGIDHLPPQDLFLDLRKAARDTGATIHHLNVHELKGQYFVDLHLEVPEQMTLGEAHAQATLLEDRIQAQVPQVVEINSHIEPAPGTHTMSDPLTEDRQIVRTVRQLVRSIPKVHDCHDVKIHRAGDDLLVTMHCTLDEHLPITQAHDVATRIEVGLRQEYPSIARVVVHLEPG